MIIFDLDGTLANCDHRRHFVDPRKNKFCTPHSIEQEIGGYLDSRTGKEFKPDWDAFHEACDKDEIIESVAQVFFQLYECYKHRIQIWSGRCESVREKTQKWLRDNSFPVRYGDRERDVLRMRPIADYTPDDILKEKWIDEAIAQGKEIEFVFDDRPKVIRMWRRRGIFVFNCAQYDDEF